MEIGIVRRRPLGVKSAKIVIKVKEGVIERGSGPTPFNRRGTENSAKSEFGKID